MNRNFFLTIFFFLIVAVGSLLARKYGLYYRYFFTDIILHFISGLMFATLWLWLTRNRKGSVFHTVTSVIMFAIVGSFLWELWEFGGWKIVPFLTRNYIPTLSDSLGDIVCGMAGGMVIAFSYYLKSKRIY